MKTRLTAAIVFSAIMLGTASPLLNFEQLWLGNTHPGGWGGAIGDGSWVPMAIDDLFVAENGHIFTNVPWEEGGAQLSQIDANGDIVNYADGLHGWNFGGGHTVAANSKYVYIDAYIFGSASWTTCGPPGGSSWVGIDRRNRSDIDAGDDFAGGCGANNAVHPDHSFMRVHEYSGGGVSLSGVAATDSRLFVASAHTDNIFVYDAQSMAPAGQWSVTDPGNLAIDNAGNLWVIMQNGARVSCYSPQGSQLPQNITLPDGSHAVDIACDNAGKLYVADAGPGSRVLVYTGLDGTPALSDSIGVKGGMNTGIIGRAEPLKFHSLAGIGVDGQGYFVVGMNEESQFGVIIESYRLDTRAMNWRIVAMNFVDCMDMDDKTERDIFGVNEHLVYDPESDEAGPEWRYGGSTLNTSLFPDDPRMHTMGWSTVMVKWLNDKRYLFFSESFGGAWAVYRFDQARYGETAVPLAYYNDQNVQGGWPPNEPQGGEYIWSDRNADGKFDNGEFASNGGGNAPFARAAYMDDEGNVWQAFENGTLRRIAVDLSGEIPRWSYENQESWSFTSHFNVLARVRYQPENDRLVLAGYSGQYPSQNGTWKHAGRVIHVFDDFIGGNRQSSRSIVPYYDDYVGDGSAGVVLRGKPMGLDAAGDYVFVCYDADNGNSLSFKGGHIEVYDLRNGNAVGNLEPKPPVGNPAAYNNAVGWMDMVDCITASKRLNGSYQIITEEDQDAKNTMFRWCPSGNCPDTVPPVSASASGAVRAPLSVSVRQSGKSLFVSPRYSTAGDFPLSVRIYDFAGRMVLGRRIHGEASISTGGLGAGTYCVSISSPLSRFSTTRRIIMLQ